MGLAYTYNVCVCCEDASVRMPSLVLWVAECDFEVFSSLVRSLSLEVLFV